MLLEQAAEGILRFDERGKILDANSEACRLVGLPREELLSRNLEDLIPLDDLASTPTVVDELRLGERVVTEMRMCRPDGVVFPAETTARRMEDGSFQAIVRDITERKRMQETVAKSRDFYLKLFEDFPNPVWRSGIDLKRDYVNKAWLDFTGRTTDEELGDGWTKGIHPEDVDSCLKTYTDAFSSRSSFEREYRLLHHSGKYRWVVDFARPFYDLEEKFGGFMGTCYDITNKKYEDDRLKRSREQLRYLSARLVQVSEVERTNIAREIHDELGQALTALKIDLSLLTAKLPKKRNDLIDQAQSMASLVSTTIRTVQRITSELRPGLLDDLGLAAAMEWQAEEFQKRTGTTCSITVRPEDMDLDRRRSTAIFRIFQETLTNVARHARATQVEAVLESRDGQIHLMVKDNGIEITDEQVSDARSTGLTGIRERALLLRGSATIRGEPKKGTTTTVNIPVRRRD
jgi:PAS domain S-box-containing protein